MKMSEKVDLLATALSKAQAEFKNPNLNKTVKKQYQDKKTNVWKEMSYKYADLPQVIESVRPPLNKHGLSFLQTTQLTEKDFILITTVVHESGQFISSFYPLPLLEKPQDMGSQISYAKRYSLCAMFGIAGEEDDDGQIAQKASSQAQKDPQKINSPELAACQLEKTDVVPFDEFDEATGQIGPEKWGATVLKVGALSGHTFDELIAQPNGRKLAKWALQQAEGNKKIDPGYLEFLDYAVSQGAV